MENIEKLKSKLDVNTQIIGVLSKEKEILNKVSRFQLAVDELNANQEKLMDLYALLQKDTSETENIKNTRRKELVDSTLKVIRFLQVFAFDQGKKKLQERLKDLTSNHIRNCSDDDLIKTSKKIWLIATKYAGTPPKEKEKPTSTNGIKVKTVTKFEKGYGLNTKMIKSIEESRIGFMESNKLYQGELKEKEKVTDKLKVVKKQTDKLLKDRIDRFVLIYETEKPNFFNEYRQLRVKRVPAQVSEAVNVEVEPQIQADTEVEKSPSKTELKPGTTQSSKAEVI